MGSLTTVLSFIQRSIKQLSVISISKNRIEKNIFVRSVNHPVQEILPPRDRFMTD